MVALLRAKRASGYGEDRTLVGRAGLEPATQGL